MCCQGPRSGTWAPRGQKGSFLPVFYRFFTGFLLAAFGPRKGAHAKIKNQTYFSRKSKIVEKRWKQMKNIEKQMEKAKTIEDPRKSLMLISSLMSFIDFHWTLLLVIVFLRYQMIFHRMSLISIDFLWFPSISYWWLSFFMICSLIS